MNFPRLQIGDVLTYNSQTHGDNTPVVVTKVDYHGKMIEGILRTASGTTESRAIPMSNESVDIKKPIHPGYSNQRLSTEDQFLKSYQSQNFAPLLRDLLSNPANHNNYLLPARIKQIKNRVFGFPEKIEMTDKIRIPMWILQDNGELDVAYVYLSESDGRLHISPGFDGSFKRLIKGDNFGLSYVTANRLDPEIESYIHKLYKGIDIPSAFPRKVRGFTGNLLASNDSLNGVEKYQYKDFSRSIQGWLGSEVFRILGFQEDILIPSRWSNIQNITPANIWNVLYLNNDFFSQLIDFSKQDSSYQHVNTIKGAYQVNVFVSYLGGRMIEWHFGIKGNELWLDNVFVRVNNPLNAYGVHGLSINAGGLISKPWEYKVQVGDTLINHAESSRFVRDIQDTRYISVEPFLNNNPLVRMYREYLSGFKG